MFGSCERQQGFQDLQPVGACHFCALRDATWRNGSFRMNRKCHDIIDNMRHAVNTMRYICTRDFGVPNMILKSCPPPIPSVLSSFVLNWSLPLCSLFISFHLLFCSPLGGFGLLMLLIALQNCLMQAGMNRGHSY